MTDRRGFLQIGLAGAVSLPFAALGARGLAPVVPLSYYKAIFDERFPASIAWARDLDRRGVPVHGIRGDVTALWYHDLYFRWKRGPVRIAGVTTKESLFCLELLARDAGLRVIDRHERDDGLVAWSIGPRGEQHGDTTSTRREPARFF
jgi:hypothetical protein